LEEPSSLELEAIKKRREEELRKIDEDRKAREEQLSQETLQNQAAEEARKKREEEMRKMEEDRKNRIQLDPFKEMEKQREEEKKKKHDRFLAIQSGTAVETQISPRVISPRTPSSTPRTDLDGPTATQQIAEEQRKSRDDELKKYQEVKKGTNLFQELAKQKEEEKRLKLERLKQLKEKEQTSDNKS